MTLEEIRNELKIIRLYYLGKADFDEAFKVVPHCVTDLIEEYADAVGRAPLDLYMIYYKLYVKGLTQESAAEDLNFSVEYIRLKNKKLLEYLRENISKRRETA